MSARLHWRRHSPGDHLAMAADLTLEEDGALLRLLDWYWMNGPIPTDVERAAKLIRVPGKKAGMVAELLARFFRLGSDGYVSVELDDERDHARYIVEQRKSAGRNGGLAKAKANAKQLVSDKITTDHNRVEEYLEAGGTSLSSGTTHAREGKTPRGVQ